MLFKATSREGGRAKMHSKRLYSLNSDVGGLHFFREMILTCLNVEKSSSIQNKLRAHLNS